VILSACAAVDQHDTNNELGDSGQTLRETIRLSKETLIVVDSPNGKTFTRLWCLYETAESPDGHLQVLTAGNVSDLKELFKKVDADRAEASTPADRTMIRGLILNQYGSLDNVTRKLKMILAAGCVEACFDDLIGKLPIYWEADDDGPPPLMLRNVAARPRGGRGEDGVFTFPMAVQEVKLKILVSGLRATGFITPLGLLSQVHDEWLLSSESVLCRPTDNEQVVPRPPCRTTPFRVQRNESGGGQLYESVVTVPINRDYGRLLEVTIKLNKRVSSERSETWDTMTVRIQVPNISAGEVPPGVAEGYDDFEDGPKANSTDQPSKDAPDFLPLDMVRLAAIHRALQYSDNNFTPIGYKTSLLNAITAAELRIALRLVGEDDFRGTKRELAQRLVLHSDKLQSRSATISSSTSLAHQKIFSPEERHAFASLQLSPSPPWIPKVRS